LSIGNPQKVLLVFNIQVKANKGTHRIDGMTTRDALPWRKEHQNELNPGIPVRTSPVHWNNRYCPGSEIFAVPCIDFIDIQLDLIVTVMEIHYRDYGDLQSRDDYSLNAYRLEFYFIAC